MEATKNIVCPYPLDWMVKSEFDKVLKRIQSGEQGLIEKSLQHRRVRPEYLEQFKQAYKNGNSSISNYPNANDQIRDKNIL